MSNKIAKKDEIDSSLAEGFEPTPHQIVWVDTAVKLGTTSPTKIARESGIDASNWGRNKWLGQEGFYDWFVSEWRRKRYHLIPELDEIAIKYAKRGKYDFWEAMSGKAGEPVDSKEGTQINIQTNVSSAVDSEEMEEFMKFREQKRKERLKNKADD